MDFVREMRHLAGVQKLYETKGVEAAVRNKLKEVQAAAKNLFKGAPPEQLADELEGLLKQANLAKPPALDRKQYNAAAAVWDLLSGGGAIADAEKAATRALKLLPEARAEETVLDERVLPKEAQKTLDSIQRWLKGVTPTANAFAKKMADVAASGAVDKASESAVITVANTLKEIVSLVARLDIAAKQALVGKEK
jgi:hypothetical protein